jgi:hypothetical protein
MKKTPLQILALVLSFVGAVAAAARGGRDETLKGLAGYKGWASFKAKPDRLTELPASTPDRLPAAMP